jgi:hypothetical protein
MERPGWINVVGVLAIVFGALGLLGAGQMAMMPQIMQMQKQMIANMQAQMPAAQQQSMAGVARMMESMWGTLPSWYQTWAVADGLVLMAIKGFYIFAALSLIQLKPSAPRQFYWAVGLSIAAAIVSAAVALLALSFMGIAEAFGSGASIVLNIVLLAVVLGGDKSVFKGAPPPLPA